MCLPEYDEDKALREYVLRNADQFMTDFEKRCLWFGTVRKKAEYADQEAIAGRSPKGLGSRIRELGEEEDPDGNVERALADGIVNYRDRLYERLLREHADGTRVVHRCPECHRIVRTPSAEQCLWCGHDWHGS